MLVNITWFVEGIGGSLGGLASKKEVLGVLGSKNLLKSPQGKRDRHPRMT